MPQGNQGGKARIEARRVELGLKEERRGDGK